MSTIGELGAFLTRESEAVVELAAVAAPAVSLRQWRLRAVVAFAGS